jgi:sugar phosphate isomerase/epimerase
VSLGYPLGVVDVVYAPLPVEERASNARADGYAHIDVVLDATRDLERAGALALPIGCPTAFPKPQPQWCATPAPPGGDGAWDRAVRWWRAAPGALLEPWAASCVNSRESVIAFMDAVPGARLLVDTGHVADWGGDPCELLEFADHVQLRQGKRGCTQLHVDDASGTVDFGAVLDRLGVVGYAGKLSIEYFDLPEHGWPLADPAEWARDLRRALLAG